MPFVLAGVRDLMFRSRIEETGRQVGVEVRTRKDPTDLIATAQDHRPALILLDLDADELNPLQIISSLRREGPLSAIPIIGFHSHVDLDRKRRALEAGCTEALARSEFTRRLPELFRALLPLDGFRRRSRGWIRLEGRDRLKWLQGMVTNDVAGLPPGGGCCAAACTRQGKMVGIMTVRLFEDHLLLETEPELVAPLRAHFERLIVMDDVKMNDGPVSWHSIDLQGPDLHSRIGIPAIPWFHHVSWRDGFASTDATNGPGGIQILVPDASSAAIERHLIDLGLRRTPDEAFETRRIENGFPLWGRDMGPDDLPSEANLDPIAVSYTKGCFLGQEVLLRVRNFSEPPRRLVHLEFDAPAPPSPGTPVASQGTEIGKITSSAPGRAIASLRKEFRKPGTRVEIRTLSAIVHDPPWHRRVDPPRSDLPQPEPLPIRG